MSTTMTSPGRAFRLASAAYRRFCPPAIRGRLKLWTRLCRIRDVMQTREYRLPWTPYRRMSREDRRHFAPVLDVWKPAAQKPLVFVSWLITEWCNYDCPYCPQTHGRFVPKEGGRYTAHGFDNHTRDEWLEAFRRHFRDRRLSLKITGGESMIDKKNMVPFLDGLVKLPTLEALRIDTNASWDPTAYRDVDKSKILLMCTFHPSQVAEEVFFQRIERLRDNGFKVGMINYVMNRDNFNQYVAIRRRAEAWGIPVQPNPLWDSRGYYSEAEIDLLRRELPDADFRYRSQTDVPQGKKCLYPAVAYSMNPNGEVAVECHPQFRGSFFDAELPRLFAGPVPCPARGCVCLDMYSFLGEVNRNVAPSPLAIYSEILLRRPIPAEDPSLPMQPPPPDNQLVDIDPNTFLPGR